MRYARTKPIMIGTLKGRQGYHVKSIVIAIAATAMASLPVNYAYGQEGSAIFGTLTASAVAEIEGSIGFESELTLILESQTTSGVAFRAEGGYVLMYGAASTMALAFEEGLELKPLPGELAPGMDLHREFFIHQAYASTYIGRFALQAGVVPISWGSAYLYNPTARTAPPEFPGKNLDTAVGRPGFVLGLSLPAGFSIQGYALASPRVAGKVPDFYELDPADFPFGIKVQAITETVDISISALRELASTGNEPSYWIGADLAAYIGPVDWWMEGALGESAMEAAVGFAYSLPLVEADIRCEFIHLGNGEAKPDLYDMATFLAGERILLARNYVFMGFEKEDSLNRRWKIQAGGLLNLNDASSALVAELSWTPLSLFELSFFGRWFSGDKAGEKEFGGTRSIAPGIGFKPYRSAFGITASWTF